MRIIKMLVLGFVLTAFLPVLASAREYFEPNAAVVVVYHRDRDDYYWRRHHRYHRRWHHRHDWGVYGGYYGR